MSVGEDEITHKGGIERIRTHHEHWSLTLDSSPPVHRGMMDLDRSAFHRSIPVLAISVPQEKTGVLLKSDVVKK